VPPGETDFFQERQAQKIKWFGFTFQTVSAGCLRALAFSDKEALDMTGQSNNPK
jgi:hypothetical protein